MLYKTRLRNAFNAVAESLTQNAADKAKVAIFTVVLGAVAAGAFALPMMPLAMIFGAAAGTFGVPAAVAGIKAYNKPAPAPNSGLT